MSAQIIHSILIEPFDRHAEILLATKKNCEASMERLCAVAAHALQFGHRIFFFGNGGSAADAQHLAAELSIRFIKDRRALAGIALTTDSSVLTACANDLGFDRVFARQIDALGQPGDLAIGISTSGNSKNVIRGLECAREKGMIAAAFTGNNGGEMCAIADPLIAVPSTETARVQEMHILLGHILCAEIEHRLGLTT